MTPLAPFLQFDADPYPVVVDGRIQWVVDGYTTTSWYPYAQMAALMRTWPAAANRRFNYVRNSVKAVVDAYDGSVTFYVVDPDDPIIQVYERAFPDLFTNDEPPEDLHAHFRYPEDLFRSRPRTWPVPPVGPRRLLRTSTPGWSPATRGWRPALAPTTTAANDTGRSHGARPTASTRTTSC